MGRREAQRRVLELLRKYPHRPAHPWFDGSGQSEKALARAVVDKFVDTAEALAAADELSRGMNELLKLWTLDKPHPPGLTEFCEKAVFRYRAAREKCR